MFVLVLKTRNESFFPANICLFKVSNRNTSKWCEICSKLTKWHSGFFIVSFEHISVFVSVWLWTCKYLEKLSLGGTLVTIPGGNQGFKGN